MADDDEVDILGDFSISSCFPGIQSDYDNQNNFQGNIVSDVRSVLHKNELISEDMGLDSGIPLNLNSGLDGPVDYDENVPNFIEDLVNTAQPTVKFFAHNRQSKKFSKNKTNIAQSLLKPDALERSKPSGTFGVDNLVYSEDDFMIGSTEDVGGTDDSQDEVNPQNANTGRKKLSKKLGNHRRKKTFSGSSGGSKSKFNISVPLKRNSKKDKIKMKGWRSEADTDVPSSPKLQLVFSSGHAVPVSEGEQVIKIEKNKETESESDVDIDVGGEDEFEKQKTEPKVPMKRNATVEIKTSFIERKFEPMRPRQRKVNLDGDGGCTIMHTESGDLIEIIPEPRKERPKKQHIQLFNCKYFTLERPAPYTVSMLVSTLLLIELHAHGSRAEVMGLLGGCLEAGVLCVRHYVVAAAAADCTHCDMCPVSQAQAAQAVHLAGHDVIGWHHSHPRFVAQPSELDLRTQRAMQDALESHDSPFVALITSQHWTRGRNASHYRFLRVESEGIERHEVGYQLNVELVADVTPDTLPDLLEGLREVARSRNDNTYRVDMMNDVCPDAGVLYLEKLISSVNHHLISAGYSEQDLLINQVVSGIRDIFR